MAKLHELTTNHLGLYKDLSKGVQSLSIGFSPNFLQRPEKEQDAIFKEIITALCLEPLELNKDHTDTAAGTPRRHEHTEQHEVKRFFAIHATTFLYYTLLIQRHWLKNKPDAWHRLAFYELPKITNDDVFLLLMSRTLYCLTINIPVFLEYRDAYKKRQPEVHKIFIIALQDAVVENDVSVQTVSKIYTERNNAWSTDSPNRIETNVPDLCKSLSALVKQNALTAQGISDETLHKTYPDITINDFFWLDIENGKTYHSIFFNRQAIKDYIIHQYAININLKNLEAIINLYFAIACNICLYFYITTMLNDYIANTNTSLAPAKYHLEAQFYQAYLFKIKNNIKATQQYIKEYEDNDKTFLPQTTYIRNFINKNHPFIRAIIKSFTEQYLETMYRISQINSQEIKNNAIKHVFQVFFNQLTDLLGRNDAELFEELRKKIYNTIQNDEHRPTVIDREYNLILNNLSVYKTRTYHEQAGKTLIEKAVKHIARKTQYNYVLISPILQHIIRFLVCNLMVKEDFQQQLVNALLRAGIPAKTIAYSYYKVFAIDPNKGFKQYIRTPRVRYAFLLPEDQLDVCIIKLEEDQFDPCVRQAVVQATELAYNNNPTDPFPSIQMIRRKINEEKERAKEEQLHKALEDLEHIHEWLQQSKKKNAVFFENYERCLPELPNHLHEATYRVLNSKKDARFIIEWSINKSTCLARSILHGKEISTVLVIEKGNEILRVIALEDHLFEGVIDITRAAIQENNENKLIPEQDIRRFLNSTHLNEAIQNQNKPLFTIHLKSLTLKNPYYCTNYNNQMDPELGNFFKNKLFPQDHDALNIIKIFNHATQFFGKAVKFYNAAGAEPYITSPEPGQWYIQTTT